MELQVLCLLIGTCSPIVSPFSSYVPPAIHSPFTPSCTGRNNARDVCWRWLIRQGLSYRIWGLNYQIWNYLQFTHHLPAGSAVLLDRLSFWIGCPSASAVLLHRLSFWIGCPSASAVLLDRLSFWICCPSGSAVLLDLLNHVHNLA